MSATTVPVTTPPTTLSQAAEIEYKAFSRSFFDNGDGVLILMATCYHMSGGFTIFFEESAEGFQLMEQPPSGFHNNIVTYSVALWPPQSTPAQRVVPAHVTITDGHGQHHVQVRPLK